MNWDKPGSKGMSEAVEHLTVLKTPAIGTATIQTSPHDSEAQYGRSYAEELRAGADLVTDAQKDAVVGVREDVDAFLTPGCNDERPKAGQPFGMRKDSFLPPAER
jgi:Asp-tRNA(Asn)/Glu-tRNA(Gln) amidotransferase A subunit family amidase